VTNKPEIKVLENLSEDEAYLFALLSDPSGLDQAEFLWQDQSSEDNKFCPHCGTEANGVHLHEHEELEPGDWKLKYAAPSECFRAWAYQWPWWRDGAALSIDQCIGEGQHVLTRRGWVPIEDIAVGDLVWTHEARWRPVTATWNRGERDVVSVRGYGHPGLIVTGDHPLWARRSRRGTVAADGHRGKILETEEWLAPDAWEFNDGKSRMVANWAHCPAGLCDVPSVPVPIRHSRKNHIDDPLIPEWLWVYGQFIAQGSTFISKTDLTARFVLSVHPLKADNVAAVLDKLNLNYYRDERERGVTCLSVNSRGLALWLREEAGHLAAGKQLATWVFGLDDERRRAIFDGLVYGDGHIRPNGRIEYTTISRRLALSVRVLAASLGYTATFQMVERAEMTIEGRVVNCADCYVVGMDLVDGRARSRVVADHGWNWGPVSGIEEAGTARVYDLEVKDDNSFVVENIVVHNCARSVGKSLSIKVRGCAFPWVFPGQEMIITAPELVHLEPIVSLIESQMYSTRTLREMLPPGRSAITHRPFQMNFRNGARIIGRIPQRDGKGVKGLHPIWLELDEAQDYPHNGWVELRETLKRGFEGAKWRAHGVTRGVRDDFYEVTQDTPDNKWRVHRFAAMWRPNWSDSERQEAIQKYGSREDPDYRRNILGLHGDKTNPIFVLTQLMKNVDSDPLSNYNSSEYFNRNIKSEKLELFKEQIVDELDFPTSHLLYAGQNEQERLHSPKAIYWVGMDIGFTIDPSEILVFVEHKPKPNAQSVLRLLTRLSLVRMPHREQIQAILHVIDFYRPKAFALDKGGVGLPLFQELVEHIEAFRAGDLDKIPAWMGVYDLETALTVIKGYSFGEKLLVEIDPSVELSPYDSAQDIAQKAGLRRNAKEFATDVLREMVDRQQLWLPWDEDLLKQFQGGTWTSNRSMDAYGRRTFSRGNDHVLDAARFVAIAWSQHAIEEMMRVDPQQPVLDMVVSPW
jgi:hypothetical protein